VQDLAFPDDNTSTSSPSFPSSSSYSSDNFRLLVYMLGATLFFVVTLLISFFLVIVMINHINVPMDVAPNLLLVGLVPPSILTVIVFTKVLGRFSMSKYL
jgi:hypothetical protein